MFLARGWCTGNQLSWSFPFEQSCILRPICFKKKNNASLVSPHRFLYNARIAKIGEVDIGSLADRYQTGDPSQLADLPSNLTVTSANDKTGRNGYQSSAAYWRWQLQFTGKKHLISSKQLPFPRKKERRPDTQLQTCPDRSLYAVLTSSSSAKV